MIDAAGASEPGIRLVSGTDPDCGAAHGLLCFLLHDSQNASIRGTSLRWGGGERPTEQNDLETGCD